MPNARYRLPLLALGLAAACGVTPAHAQGWAEHWFDNVTYTSPGPHNLPHRGTDSLP